MTLRVGIDVGGTFTDLALFDESSGQVRAPKAPRNPAHELGMRELIEEEHPDARVSLSHEVYPRWREYDRMSTTLADAFLKTLGQDYVAAIAHGLDPTGVRAHFLLT